MTPEERYARLDQPDVLKVLFHPRAEDVAPPAGVRREMVEIAAGVQVECRLHLAGPASPVILFFHGNGEIAADYDDDGPRYIERDLSFVAVGYRGYGAGSGRPTVAAMMADAVALHGWLLEFLAREGRTGKIFVMGRSLGSAVALELGAELGDDLAGIIVESGFADTVPLLQFLGVDAPALGISEKNGFGNVKKIQTIKRPTLLLHAQKDELIPLENAGILHSESGARNKEFQVIPGARHNNILQITGPLYFQEIRRFIDKVIGTRGRRRR